MHATVDRALAALGAGLVVATGAVAILAPGRPAAKPRGPAVTAGTSARISIQDYAFTPAALHVSPGARVSFTNRDSSNHTGTATQGPGFDTGTIGQGQTRTVVLSKPGTYGYICQFHAFMHGSIVVG